MSVFLQDVKTAFFKDVILFSFDEETPYNLGSFSDLSKVFFFSKQTIDVYRLLNLIKMNFFLLNNLEAKLLRL